MEKKVLLKRLRLHRLGFRAALTKKLLASLLHVFALQRNTGDVNNRHLSRATVELLLHQLYSDAWCRTVLPGCSKSDERRRQKATTYIAKIEIIIVQE